MESSLNALIFPVRVLGEDLGSFFRDELALHPVVGVLAQTVVLAGELALVGQVAALQLAHALLDLLEVVRGERCLALEVVIEAGIGGRSDAQLRLRKQLEDGRGQQVRGGVTVHGERFGTLRGEDLQLRVGLQRAGQVVQLVVDPGDNGIVGQATGDGTSHVDGPRSRRKGLHTAVGKRNVYSFIHLF